MSETGEQPGGQPQVQYREPDDYAELKGYKERYNALSETLAPYVDDIRPIIENEGDREYWRTARKSRDLLREQQEPQMDPQFAPLVSHFEKQFAPVVEYATNAQKREREAAEATERDTKAAEATAFKANEDYARRLIADRPDLAEDEFAGIGMLAAYAAHRKISLEEAWNRKGNTLGAPAKKVTPPTSLRGDAAAPGVPGESKQPKITSKIGLRNRLAANLRAGGMKG